MEYLQFFTPPDEPRFAHPMLRFVANRREAGDEIRFELHRPRAALGFDPARIYLHLLRDGIETDCKQDGWDDDLNGGLIRMGVRAVSIQSEIQRFSLGLRAAFRPIERRYGEGFFNAVFVEFVRASDFRDIPAVADVLRSIPAMRPSKQSRSAANCLEMIQEAIRGRGLELSQHLKYDAATDGWKILAGAVAAYLDERFSVTNRKLLGMA